MTARMAGAEGRPSSPFVAGPLGLTMRTHECEMFFSNTRAGDFSEPANDGVQAVETLSGIPLSAWAQDDQVHGAEVRLTAADEEPIAFHHAVDGQLTSRRGVLCAVRTADCLPVLVAGGGVAGALHAGWRGLAAGIIESGVAQAQQEAEEGAGLAAAIGPGARGCCYEVSSDVREVFANIPRAIAGSGNVDLAAVAEHKLRAAGVETIYDSEICTICSRSDEFFSYRRDGGRTGRMLGAAWLI